MMPPPHSAHWPYLPFLLVWALPIIALQWLAGGRYLWRERRLWPWIVVGLCVYFSLADAVAIEAGIWRFDTASLVGITIGPVPIEEILFYLLTATMVVQGFVIAWAAWADRNNLLARWRKRIAFIARRVQANKNKASWSAHKRYEAGVWAVPLALAPGFLLAALFSVPTPLEPLTEFVMQATPIAFANVLLVSLGSFARTAALLGAIAICLPTGGLVALTAPGQAGQRIRWLITAAIALLAALPLALAAAYIAEAVGALLMGALFVPALLLTKRWQGRSVAQQENKEAGAKNRRSRRGALRTLAGSAFTVGAALALGTFDVWAGALGSILGRGEMVRTLFPFLPPTARMLGFPVPGEEPEVTPVAQFYLIDKNDVDPLIESTQWTLLISGLVNRPLRLSYAELLAMPRIDEYVTLRCIDNLPETHLMSNAYWSGVPLASLLARAGVSSGAGAITIHAPDGYDEVLPFEAAMDPITLIVYGMNGQMLPRIHGGPVRLIVPGFYGFKNVKWIESIEVVSEPTPGYWASRGWTAERIHSVARIDTWHATPEGLLVGGVAFAGTQGISAVELRVNDGMWQMAELNTPALSHMCWVQWRNVLALHPGTYRLTARMIDGQGQPQTEQVNNVYPGGATGLHTVTVTVQ